MSDGRPIHQLPATHGSPVSTLELLEKDRDGRLVASSVAAANMAKIDANGEKDREEEAAGSAPLNEPAPVSGAATSQMEAHGREVTVVCAGSTSHPPEPVSNQSPFNDDGAFCCISKGDERKVTPPAPGLPCGICRARIEVVPHLPESETSTTSPR